MLKNALYLLLIILNTFVLSSCKSSTYTTENTVDNSNAKLTTNSKASQKKPYVILISLDGFRWDYVERFKPPHLNNFIKNGVQAESLIPSFPSKTFPNHYTIATGMYPDKNGIIGNEFYNYKKENAYSIRDRETVEDGSYYKGTPIWIQADNANMVSASYFFVGSEADIQGKRPTYYKRFDSKIKNEVRVDEALKWLALPEKSRPHMITMYFADMDNTGHRYGTNNDEKLKETLFSLDSVLGDLFKGIKETKLPVNIIIVSDHGMTTVQEPNFIATELIKNDSLYTTIDNGAIINIHPKDSNQIDSIYASLKPKENNFKVYKTKDTPGFEYIPTNKDWGTIQIIPDFGYYFISKRRIENKKKFPETESGVHGYDPKYKDMHGIFYANGPAFKKGYTTPSVKNVHIYPIMCEILVLEIPSDIDGKLSELKSILISVEK